MKECTICVANKAFSLNLLYKRTAFYFKDYEIDWNTDTNKYVTIIPPVNKRDLAMEVKRLNDPYFAEYSLLFRDIVNHVLPDQRFFFHGAAFIWRGSAFLFSGPSGVGKTTQLLNWLKLYPDEIEIINGDKPLIEVNDHQMIVHPSPWGGKEGYNGKQSAVLKGIILLEQGNTDRLLRLKINDAVYPLFLQFLYKPEDLQSVDSICRYENILLSSIPVWKLINRGTAESAIITHNQLLNEVFL